MLLQIYFLKYIVTLKQHYKMYNNIMQCYNNDI